MKVCIFHPYTFGSPDFATALELIEQHVEKGDTVHVVVCEAELEACVANPQHRSLVCQYCILRRDHCLGLIPRADRVVVRRLECGKVDIHSIPGLAEACRSIEGLSGLSVDGFDVGLAVLSTLGTARRDAEPDLVAARSFVERSLVVALGTFRYFLRLLGAEAFDVVYVYNGRFAVVRAAVRACQRQSAKFYTYDSGCSPEHYELFEDTFPHDVLYLGRRIREAWDAADDAVRREIGERFFQDCRRGRSSSRRTFIGAQQEGRLPAEWSKEQKNIVFFTSSDDEMAAAARDDPFTLYRTQWDCLEAIMRYKRAGADERFRLHIRMHPRQSLMHPEVLARWTRVAAQMGAVLIGPADSVSTYALVDAADTVITFGSTVGVEATYWGRPSISAGPATYSTIDAVYTPRDHAELMRLIEDPALPAKPRENALAWGYYISTFGRPFRHYSPEDFVNGTYRGRSMNPPLIRAWNLVRETWIGKWIRSMLTDVRYDGPGSGR